jgi:5-methylcytosine-specific restriction endonuclease McrA
MQGSSDPRYGTAQWKALRRQVKSEEPTCRRCQHHQTRYVDHIVEAKDGGDFFDRANLQGMCSACHFRKTREVSAARAGRPKPQWRKLVIGVGTDGLPRDPGHWWND